MKKLIVLSLLTIVAISSCKKDTKSTTTPPPTNTSGPQLKFVFKFDSTQDRLNAFGQVNNTLPAGNLAQSPHFNGMSVHHIEMAQGIATQVGFGAVLYTTPTVVSPNAVTVTNGTTSVTYADAIDFSKEKIVGDGQEFYSIPLSQVTAGTYPYLRVSVAYQNYEIKYGILAGTTVNGYTYPSNYYSTGTIASFIGYNTYVNSYKVKDQTISPATNKAQGYWAFESAPFVYGGVNYTITPSQGQAPQNATTVVNPLFASSAVPPGSCLVTGQFVNQAGTATPLIITGNETSDVVITVSMSTNKSFEWAHNSSNPNDGYIYTLNGDVVVDMGVRGMMPKLPN